MTDSIFEAQKPQAHNEGFFRTPQILKKSNYSPTLNTYCWQYCLSTFHNVSCSVSIHQNTHTGFSVSKKLPWKENYGAAKLKISSTQQTHRRLDCCFCSLLCPSSLLHMCTALCTAVTDHYVTLHKKLFIAASVKSNFKDHYRRSYRTTSGYDCQNKCVFSFWRNVASDWTSSGRLFQSRGPAAAKHRSPTVTRRDGRTSRRLDERSRPRRLVRRSATYCSRSDKYWGAVPWRAR